MSENQSNSRRIAKNTILLYFRMILVMLISLFTSRVILSTLGIEDFGIYNVVGGIVTTMSFLNSALAAASQRFISYELGKGNLVSLNKVFSTSLEVHSILAIICVIFFESVGLWFLNNKLNIDPVRLSAANWVFQCSIVSFVISVLNVPYNATIIAHEKMGAFAYISIFEVFLKLLITIALLYTKYDKLILYTVLYSIVSYVIRLCYVTYCKRSFSECHFRIVTDKELFKKIFSFASWSVIGNIGFTLKDPLSNILLNLFFGTRVNAARGIAMQVNGVINSFATNFGMAINPQIVKQYASGNITNSIHLVYTGARYSFYLLTIISIPIIINIDFILKLWLGNVPEYTNIFFVLTIISSLIYSLSGTSSVAVQATGNIKWFSIGVCIIPIIELPITYFFLSIGFPPYMAMAPTIPINLVALLFRFYILNKLINGYSWSYFIINILFRSFASFVLSILICIVFKHIFSDNVFELLFSMIVNVIISIVVILIVGVDRDERIFILNKVLQKIKKHNGIYV